MKSLVLAAGRGANMAPFSATRPNPMIPVAGRCLVDHLLDQLKEAGVSLVNMVIGHKGGMLRRHVGEDHPSGLSIHFIDQGRPRGIGQAILAAKDRFTQGEHFLLVYGDTLAASNIFSVTLQSFALSGEPTAAVCHAISGEKYGNVYFDKDTRITKFIEKPMKEKGLGNYVFAGVFALPVRFFDYLEKAGGNMEKALGALIRKETLHASIWEDDWLDMAYPWDILTANRSIMSMWKNAVIHESVEAPPGVLLRGPVVISEGVEIMPGAVLQGPAYIGPGSFIGHNALIRPFSCVGERAVVGQGAELKNCVIFPGAVVGRLSFIGDSVIGENVDVGADTMTLNRYVSQKPVSVRIRNRKVDTGIGKLGAFIGDGAVVGASNTLAPGVILEAGSMIEHNYSNPKRT